MVGITRSDSSPFESLRRYLNRPVGSQRTLGFLTLRSRRHRARGASGLQASHTSRQTRPVQRRGRPHLEGRGFDLSFVYACFAGPFNLLPASLRSLHCTREWPRSL